jgi:hypothetical protein
MGLTKSWAMELAPHGVHVVAVSPTGVNTPMNDGLATLEGATPEEIGERSAGNLLPVPWIEPADVAEAVLFLASDGARYVTGSPLVVDAGPADPLSGLAGGPGYEPGLIAREAASSAARIRAHDRNPDGQLY